MTDEEIEQRLAIFDKVLRASGYQFDTELEDLKETITEEVGAYLQKPNGIFDDKLD